MKTGIHTDTSQYYIDKAFRYRSIVAIVSLALLLFSPLYFAYYKYLPLYVLQQNLNQFNEVDLLELVADVDTDSEMLESIIVTTDGEKQNIGIGQKRGHTITPLVWKQETMVKLGSAHFSKKEYASISMPFQGAVISSLLSRAIINANKVVPGVWHITVEGRLVKEQLDELIKRGILLIDSKIADTSDECEAGAYQDFMTRDVVISDELVGDLEFFIDPTTRTITRIIVPEPKYMEVTIDAFTCETEPKPVHFIYKTGAHAPTITSIKELKLRSPVVAGPKEISAVYRFIFKNIWL